MIPSELLQILADPNDPDRGPLTLVDDQLLNIAQQRAYPIVEGVPMLRPEDAIPLENTQNHE